MAGRPRAAPGLVSAALLAGAGLAGCGPRSASTPASIPVADYVPMPGRSDLPFSALVRVGPMLYLSGQLGTDSTGHLVPGGSAPRPPRR